MRTFLMISPLFPPSRLIGAKRSLTFARNLPAFGWRPAVVALPEEAERDEALVPHVPDVPIWRGFRSGPLARREDAKGRTPRAMGYLPAHDRPRKGLLAGPFGQLDAILAGGFDRYTRYLPWSFAGSVRFARAHGCQLVYVNAGPYSAAQLGALVAAALRVPFVLDLRDMWSLDPDWRRARAPAGQKIVDVLEELCISRADAVVMQAAAAIEEYQRHYAGRVPPSRFHLVRNAFNPDLYGPLPPPPGPTGPFRLAYYGHLRARKNAVPLLRALRRLMDEQALGAGDVELLTMGLRTPEDEAGIRTFGLEGVVRAHPHVPFTECRAVLGRADLLVDLLSDGQDRRISGKIFDYLACERPILTIGPNWEMDEIYADTKAGTRVELDDDAILGALRRALEDKRAGKPFTPDRAGVAKYAARPAAEKLAGVFDSVG